MNIFNILLVNPITNLLVALYLGLSMIGIPYALGFAIIGLTILIRFILYPITASQLKMSKKMQEINPHISALKTKHKDDPKTLQTETMKLYSEYGVNPLAGCIPTILQMVVLFGLYAVLNEIAKDPRTVLTHLNSIVYFPGMKLTHVWDTTFFGLPLTKKPSELLSVIGPLILLLPILTGVLQFIQSAMMFSSPKTPVVKKKGEDAVDFAAAMQSNTMYIFPFMIGYFSFTFPLALALYWNTFTIFGIIQQYRVGGLGRLGEWQQKFFPRK
jgi:YidC/Oxa1 family membrane protein insertase